MKKLAGKVAVITGGTTGIGLAAAKLFVSEGAYVFITGRRQKELDEAVKEIGSNVTGVQGDVSKPSDLDCLYETVKTKGRIDIVFANAGVGEFAPLGKITEEHFDKIFNINVRGTLFTVQKALPLLNDGGSIILTGSVASIKGTPAFADSMTGCQFRPIPATARLSRIMARAIASKLVGIETHRIAAAGDEKQCIFCAFHSRRTTGWVRWDFGSLVMIQLRLASFSSSLRPRASTLS